MTGDAFRGNRVTVPAVIEHREGRLAYLLREHGLAAALVIAAFEGALVIAGAIPWWTVLVLAAAALALYLAIGRESSVPAIRSVSWIAAVSQLAVVLVPVLAAVVAALAIAAVLLVALAALVVLLLDRR
jgi:FtsH-binding integral membrane protein